MSKNKVLHDPIKPKMRAADKEFANPTKEQATTGRFMPAGDVYGSGFTNPIGHASKPKGLTSGPIPFGCDCFHPGDAVH